jgi:putative membrane protein
VTPEAEWKRLHPATPLLKGGIAFVAVLGFIFASFRERIVETAVGSPDVDNVVVEIYERGQLGWALAIVVAVLLVGVIAFALSWLMHRYRISAEAVEVKSGILFRTNRKARLDRIQDIVITRPTLARLFGAARLELSVAGQDSTVQLSYLRGGEVELLRQEILRLAGSRVPAELAVDQSAAPEVAADSLVKIPTMRLVGSILMRGMTLGFVLVVGGLIAGTVLDEELTFALLLVPVILGGIGYFYSHLTRSLRFSIAGSAEGVRIGYGLLTLSNDTLPPGRIHAIEAYQSVLWRPLGWWAVRINRAGHGPHHARSKQSAIVLPVGRLADVERVLALLLPASTVLETSGTIRAGLYGTGRRPTVPESPGSIEFIGAPARAFWLRPLSWRRTAFAVTPDEVLIRRGWLSRSFVVVPLARLQSLDFRQGPVRRRFALAQLRLHTVPGPVQCLISIPSVDDAQNAFAEISAAAVQAVTLDSPDNPPTRQPEAEAEPEAKEIGAVQ